MVTQNPLLNALATYPAEALYAKKAALRAAGVEVFDFSVGDPIEPTARVLMEALKAGVPTVSQYPSVRGTALFRQAVTRWMGRRFGVELDPESQVLPTSGSKEAIFHLPLVFVDPAGPRRRVLYGTPAYPVYERGTLFAGGLPWPVELEAAHGYRLEPWRLPPELIDETAILWINYPHNPTAATVERSYLARLYAFCREREILLCADECYVDMYFDASQKPPSLLELGQEGALVFHSLSKRSGITGYRSGFVAGDPALIALLTAARGNFGVAQTDMVQAAAIAAWDDEAHAAARRELFRSKRDLFREFFAEVGLRYAPCEATLYLWVELPAGESDAMAYAERLMDAGILVSPAPLQGVDQPYFRLALVPPLEECRRAIAAWRQLL